MASICTLFSVFLVICIHAGNANTDFVNLKCSDKNVGQFGQQSLLTCVIHTTPEVSNPEIRVVTWRKNGEILLVYFDGETKPTEGYKFAEPYWNNKNMNVSLLIANTVVRNEGDYECDVTTDSGVSKGKINLQITANYSAPTIESTPKKIPQGTDGTLTCNSDGGYPKGVLRWFDEYNTDWTKSSELTASKTERGLFHLSSKLTLKSGSIFKYTCVVYNARGEKLNEAKFDPEPDSGSSTGDEVLKSSVGGNLSSKVVAPVVVIGSLIVGLLMALLFIRRRSQKARRHSTAPLMVPDRKKVSTLDGEEEDTKSEPMKV